MKASSGDGKNSPKRWNFATYRLDWWDDKQSLWRTETAERPNFIIDCRDRWNYKTVPGSGHSLQNVGLLCGLNAADLTK
jgi:hypothetical protein